MLSPRTIEHCLAWAIATEREARSHYVTAERLTGEATCRFGWVPGRYTTSTAKALAQLESKIYSRLRKKILVAADLFVGLREI